MEDSDGEEIQNIKELEPYSTLHLVPGNGVTELQAKINFSTNLCLERRLTRSIRSEYQALYQWEGHWDDNGKFLPNNGPVDWIPPTQDTEKVQLPEFHSSPHRQSHFEANMRTPPMTKLPQLKTMDKVRFHTHFADVSSLDGIQRRKHGELESGCSFFYW